VHRLPRFAVALFRGATMHGADKRNRGG
jgi:hypothetical protein